MGEVVYVCGGNEAPWPRDECPNSLHDWPLPVGFVESEEVATSRLSRKWAQVYCLTCGKYGWLPGYMDGETPTPAPESPPKPLAAHLVPLTRTGVTNAQRDEQTA